jgi:hypothetical protein
MNSAEYATGCIVTCRTPSPQLLAQLLIEFSQSESLMMTVMLSASQSLITDHISSRNFTAV